jgi:hypothetical protein
MITAVSSFVLSSIDDSNFSDRIFRADSIHIEADRIQLDYPFYSISDSTLSLSNTDNLRQLSGIIPSFYLSDYGSSSSGGAYYRGLGNRQNGAGVVMYLDGVPLMSGMDVSNRLFDVSGVYFGMQGHSSSAFGELHLNSKSVFNPSTNILMSYGNANTGRVQLEHNNKIGGLHFGIIAGGSYTDGFEDNIFKDEKGNRQKDYYVRLKFDGSFSDIFFHSTTFRFNYLDENCFPYREFTYRLNPYQANDNNSYLSKNFMLIENLQ